MRRLTITIVLALGLITSLVLSSAGGARPFDPPGGAVIVDAGPCPAQESPRLLVPAGVYRALADELRQQGYSSAQIKAETGDALVTPATDSRAASANCDRSR
jgi:hypothetical protein